MNTEIESKLRDYLAKNILFVEDGFHLANDASFLEGGVIDSLGFMELLEYTRLQFGLEVPDCDIIPANFDSITAIAGYVRRQLSSRTRNSLEKLVGAELGLESMTASGKVAKQELI